MGKMHNRNEHVYSQLNTGIRTGTDNIDRCTLTSSYSQWSDLPSFLQAYRVDVCKICKCVNCINLPKAIKQVYD